MRTTVGVVLAMLLLVAASSCSGSSASGLQSGGDAGGGGTCGSQTCTSDEACCNIADASGSCTPYCVRGSVCPAVACQSTCSDCGPGTTCCEEANASGSCSAVCVAGTTCPAVSCSVSPPPPPPSGPDGGAGCPAFDVFWAECGTPCFQPQLQCNYGGVGGTCVVSTQGNTWACYQGGLTQGQD